MEIGRQARQAATAALASYINPLPHYRGQPSALIASIVVDIARQLELPEAEIDRIQLAALLHDVGKVAIPEEILEKPSALSTGEWRSVVQHPRIGQVILEQAAALKDAVPIILHHHERYAGHGYPYGLRANEIPLGARIVAIADAYDAMIHDRPYKRAMTHDQAIAELRRHAGTQFDPELVSLFCDLYAAARPAARPGGAGDDHGGHPGDDARACSPGSRASSRRPSRPKIARLGAELHHDGVGIGRRDGARRRRPVAAAGARPPRSRPRRPRTRRPTGPPRADASPSAARSSRRAGPHTRPVRAAR